LPPYCKVRFLDLDTASFFRVGFVAVQTWDQQRRSGLHSTSRYPGR